MNPPDGATIHVDAGQRLEIVLPENPTTGYRWQVAETPAALTSDSPPKFELKGLAVGAGGTRAFAFRALAAPGGRLTFELRRVRGTPYPERRLTIAINPPRR